MTRLSSPIEAMQPHYDVVVVGSGYGGAIAAARLARAGRRVCVLERGKEFQPGEYPDTQGEALREMQAQTPHGRIGPRTGLYDFHLGHDINVFVGCGLGGTSLVNANVSLRAEPRVFEDPRWPAALRADVGSRLEEGYRRAEAMLKPVPYPDTFPRLPKLAALEKSADALKARCTRPPIAVTFASGVNHAGVEQHACVLCGDCVSGCNHGAKNTVLMNYLPDARRHGAELFTCVSVRRLGRQGGRWQVHYHLLRSGRELFDAPTLCVTADVVVLAAGTLGSTEILLRSRAHGLAVSDQLGRRVTGNGDVLGFGYNTNEVINGVGFGHRPAEGREPVGPCITGLIDLRERPRLEDGMVIEEGAIPGALGAFLPAVLAAAAKLAGRDAGGGFFGEVDAKARELESLFRGPYHGAVRHSQTYLVMSHDDAGGRLSLDEHDRLRLDWPGVGKQPSFERVNERLAEATRPLGGTYVPNPSWSALAAQPLITVHPLGGCVMGDDATQGVVNHKGQIFRGPAGDAVHEGLYVCDGSIIPRPLGVNPLLTISALAERAMSLLAEDRGWVLREEGPAHPPPVAAPSTLGLRFTETMRGFVSLREHDDYRRGAEQGRADGSPCEFTVTIISRDLERLLEGPAHAAAMVGTVTAPALAAAPMTITDGRFHLLPEDPERVGARRMTYRMVLLAPDGRRFFFEGFKSVQNDAGPDVWADTTTLYVTVRDGPDAAAPILAKGVLAIDPANFAWQLTTMEVTNAPDLRARLSGLARFGRFFAGALLDTYGGIVARPAVFDPDAPPRKRRPLRTGPPTVHHVRTADGTSIRVTRYQGGGKGPVMLAHGLGVSSRIFSLDTVETNLVEYLVAHDFDVWLLDSRASIELPGARTRFTADDIATQDYPAAVDLVRRLTGAPSVQVVAHCFGSTTFVMAMLAGLGGVRAAVCSQVATHIVAPPITNLKVGLHLPEVLSALGITSLTAYVDRHADWKDRLFDLGLKAYPVAFEEQCRSPVCRRITFMYAPLYRHGQLNALTHDTLHELFGIANMRAFEHLALMTARGHIVAADGREAYLPHLERLAIPLAFIHGERNECFLPESTALTVEHLARVNGPALYRRHVIPEYGHIDCIVGKDADRDVYPLILAHLNETA
ncbi:GMC oxidoreductase [Candidatus Nitrospira bockiana]